VCLTGPAGCGKTRLALEAARLWAGETRIAGPASAAAADVGPIIASALGLGYEAEDVVTAARMALAGRRLLLVADDCDHVTAAAAEQLTALVRAVPGLHVLATSRHPLGISEEQVLPVMPLACPVGSGQSHRRGRRSWKPATGRPCPRPTPVLPVHRQPCPRTWSAPCEPLPAQPTWRKAASPGSA
jgi:predicted ATPase